MDPTPSPAASPSPAPDSAPRRRGGKRKASAATSSSPIFPPPKRLMKERNALTPLPAAVVQHHGPVTRATRHTPYKLAATPPPEAVDTSAEAGAGTGVGVGVEEERGAVEERPVVDLEFEKVRLRGNKVHAVPTPAGWFSWTKIHQIEKHTMRSFFNGKFESRTPEIYTEIRNSIMKKFHSDPETLVEVKDLEELSAGDLDARQEVLEFLDHWGLINFHPFPPVDASNANVDVVSRVSSLMEKFYRFESVQSSPCVAPKKVELPTPATRTPDLNLVFGVSGDLAGPVEPSVEYHCNSCSADCSRKRYHCQKQADYDLCTDCYTAGKFGSGMAAADFILMEPADVPVVSSGSWTDQETLLLLEALELFGENWSEIAEHVATKTKDQCMLHFIQMPIEDPFLDVKDDEMINIMESKEPTLVNKESDSAKVSEAKESKGADEMDEDIASTKDDSKGEVSAEIDVPCKTDADVILDILNAAFQAVGYLPEQGQTMSFARAGNPVMAVAAFLAGLVEPDAATTSVRSSLKAMSEDSPGIQLATRHCYLLEDPPIERKDPPETESMDIEQPHKGEEQIAVSNGMDVSKDPVDKNENDGVQEEKEAELSSSLQKPPAEDKVSESVPLSEATHMNTEDSGHQSLEENHVMAIDKDASVVPMALPPSTGNVSADLALQGEDTTSTAMDSNNLEVVVEEKASSSKELEEKSNGAGVITSTPAEGPEEQQKTTSNSPVKSREKSGDDDKIAPLNNDDKEASLNDFPEKLCDSAEANDVNKKPTTDADETCKSVEAKDDEKAPLNADDEMHSVEGNNANIAPPNAVDKVISDTVETGNDKKTPLNDVDEKNCSLVEDSDSSKAPLNDVDVNKCNAVEGNDDKHAPLDDVGEKNTPVEANDDKRTPPDDVCKKNTLVEANDDKRTPPDDVCEKNTLVEANADKKAPPDDVGEKSTLVEANDDKKTPLDDLGENNTLVVANDDKKVHPDDVCEKNSPVEANDIKGVPPNDVDEKNNTPVKVSADSDLSKIRRAAVTALSAAAVKAKFLANQEEEQIMQLVSLVIEKQLRKLETKLGQFTEMESAIFRVKEPMERAKQRLLQERQQIVSARLGIPVAAPAASKPPLGYGPALLRPPPMKKP